MEKESNDLFEPTITMNEAGFVNDIFDDEFSVSFIAKIGDIFKYVEPNNGSEAHILDQLNFDLEDSHEHGPNLYRIQQEIEPQVKYATMDIDDHILRPRDGNAGIQDLTSPIQVVQEAEYLTTLCSTPSSIPRNDVIESIVYSQDIAEETIGAAKYNRKINQEASDGGGSNNKWIFETVNTQDEYENESIGSIESGTRNMSADENSVFKTRQTFQSYNSVDTDQKSYACDAGNKTFDSESNLNVQLQIHKDERPYVCETCNASFTQKQNLKKHSSIHTDEKLYTCGICDKSFRQHSGLQSHSILHKAERPHLCDICKRSFRRKSDLLQHSRIHTGEKPFVCNICQKAYAHRNSLRYHSYIHTGGASSV